MILETVEVGDMQVNCYLLADKENGKAIIIDPGEDARKIKAVLAAHFLSPALVVNTHGHIDHIAADDAFGCPVYAHRLEVRLLQEPSLNLSLFLARSFRVKSQILALEEGQMVGTEEIQLQVIHTPGHSPGGIALVMKKPDHHIVFSGDSLFCGTIGRTDFPGADQETLVRSIKEKLLSLPDDTIVYPGHGGATTVGKEKECNPYLQ